ncbi:MAG: hypothetical protein QM791_19795 [Ferruginibacter sp.]
MKIILLKPYYLVLIPVLMAVAVILYILDNLNVDVNPLISYTEKEKQP